MPDLLVRLYQLPPIPAAIAGLTIRRAFAAEKSMIVEWIRDQFGHGWADEADIACTRQPVALFIALHDCAPVGFACYDSTARGFFGPTGVIESMRHRGIGRHLLRAALHDMAAQGYGYAIIGAASSLSFYEREAGAVEIPDSTPGFYRDLLRREPVK
jgi:GNAT superfamily N-acetyltransferase